MFLVKERSDLVWKFTDWERTVTDESLENKIAELTSSNDYM